MNLKLEPAASQASTAISLKAKYFRMKSTLWLPSTPGPPIICRPWIGSISASSATATQVAIGLGSARRAIACEPRLIMPCGSQLGEEFVGQGRNSAYGSLRLRSMTAHSPVPCTPIRASTSLR